MLYCIILLLLYHIRPPAAGPVPWVSEHRWMVIAGWGLLANDYCLVIQCFVDIGFENVVVAFILWTFDLKMLLLY